MSYLLSIVFFIIVLNAQCNASDGQSSFNLSACPLLFFFQYILATPTRFCRRPHQARSGRPVWTARYTTWEWEERQPYPSCNGKTNLHHAVAVVGTMHYGRLLVCRASFAVCFFFWHMANALFAVCKSFTYYWLCWHTAKEKFVVCPCLCTQVVSGSDATTLMLVHVRVLNWDQN